MPELGYRVLSGAAGGTGVSDFRVQTSGDGCCVG